MAHKTETVVASFPFHQSRARWAGSVEVVERDQTFDDGNRKVFSDFRIKVGDRYLLISSMDPEEICESLIAGAQAAKLHFQELRAKQEEETKREGRPAPRRDRREGY